MPDILKKHFYLSLFFLMLCQGVSAQSFKAYEKAGDKAFSNKDYYAAMYYYSNALERKPEEPGVAYKYAEMARQFNAFEEALKYYKITKRKGEKHAFPEVTYWMGVVSKNMGNYEEAKEYLGEYKGSRYAAEAKKEIMACDWAIELNQNPDPFKIEKLNKRVNTAYSEFGALQRGDTIYYSSYRFENKEDSHDPKRKLTKLLTSVNGGKGRQMRRSFNVEEKHTAHTTFSLNSKRIYFTVCDFVNANDIRCEIYYREKDKRKRWKKTPMKLPEKINKAGFTTTHPHIAFDPATQKETLFFVSDRTGGEGGLDIWKVSLDEKGKFEDPVPLIEINSVGNDISPYLVAENSTLYFSSDGRQGLGGYDIFKYDGVQISHMGSPLNSSYNDVYFSVDANEKNGLFSSNRPGAFYLDSSNKACCNDIYRFEYVEPKTEEDSTEIVEIPTLEPQIETKTTPEIKIPNKLEDFLPLALYFDNDEPDKRTRRTTTKKTYGESFQKYYKNKTVYLEEFTKPLGEDDQAEAELLIESFFEEEVKRGHDFLYRFSEILLERLEAGEDVEIFIKGYTSPRAKSDYNLSLGQRRISSLRNHFGEYENGVFQSYLEKDQLKITERSFGETQASTQVSDALEDVRNSIYNPNAAKERRVEIVEIKRGEQK